MSSFVDNVVETAEDSARAIERMRAKHPSAKDLVKALAGKTRILVTCHMHPDPDALGAGAGMKYLLERRLPGASVDFAVRGQIGGGVNDAFTRYAKLELDPWPEDKLGRYDAVVMVDGQPTFPNSPLPKDVSPTVVVDHHRSRRKVPDCDFCDVRPDVGATASIVFGYFCELEEPVPPVLSAVLLYAIESDLAGAAGQPSDLDNLALSSLTLTADTRRLYKMRNIALPQSYFAAYAAALGNAVRYGDCLVTAIGDITSQEVPAVMADFLLRFDEADWVLVTGRHDEDGDGVPDKLVLSLRTNGSGRSAGEVMRNITRDLGTGGGHRTKAGGIVPLDHADPDATDKARAAIKRQLLRELHIGDARGSRFIQDCGQEIDVTGGTATARPAKD